MHVTDTPPLLRATSALAMFAVLAACSRDEAASAPTDPAPAAIGSPTALETRPRHGVDYEPAFEGQTRAPGLTSGFELDVAVVAEGLDSPWAFEFLPDDRILVTERPGTLRIIDQGGTLSAPVQGVPAVLAERQGGLLDVALDPQFTENRTIYWSYAEPRDGGSGTALAKGVLVENGGTARLENVQVIFRQQPTLESALHFGSRIVFTPDGKLFLTMGERAIPSGRVQAQDLNSHFGKVVRLNPDGSVPQDNPFVGRSDAQPEIWSYGHRNVQAAALDADGKLWTIEHGPLGGDELNQPQAGRNYGWPVIGYGIDYSGQKMGDGITAKEGLEQPVYYWDPVIAPSGMIFYSGEMFPEWQGDLFVGGMASLKLVRLELQNGKVAGEEWLLQDRKMRFRDVKQGQDGAIYVVADGPNASLLRISRKT